MPNSFRYVSNGPKKKKKIISCPRAGLPEGSPRLGSVSPFSYLLLQFSRFLQSDFCKMLVRGLSKKLKNRFLNFCLQKIWHTDKVGVPKKVGFFSKHQLGQCAKFFVGKNSKIWQTELQTNLLRAFCKKNFVKILKIVEEDRKTVKVYPGKKQRR